MKLDALIKEVIIPYNFFYIRYFDDSHHLRLRVQCTEEDDDTIYKAIQGYCKRDLYLKTCKVIRKEYVPEVSRYGGSYGLEISQKIFMYSSICSLKLLLYNPETISYPKLLSRAIMVNYLTASCFLPKDCIKEFFSNYAKIYCPYPNIADSQNHIRSAQDENTKIDKKQLTQLLNILEHNITSLGEAGSYLKDYKEAIKNIKNKIDVKKLEPPTDFYKDIKFNNPIESILISYIHMNNNRLRILVNDESYIAHLISQSL